MLYSYYKTRKGGQKMKVVMKDYELKHFKEKDIYEIEEVLKIIKDMEMEIDILQEKVEELEQDI